MTPFIKVYINNDPTQDITDFVEEFSLEDTIKKDNMIEVKIRPDRAIELLDDKDIDEGSLMSVQFGFLGDEISQVHTLKIVDIDGKYRGKLSLTLRGLDKGNRMKKVPDNKIWKGLTSTQIAQEIATKHGLTLISTPTKIVWANMPQANKTDFEFLKYLAERETSGRYLFYVRNDFLYFDTIALEEESLMTYTYNNDERLISFDPKYRTSTSGGVDAKATLAAVNPDSKKATGTSVDNSNKKDDTLLGDYEIVVDNFGTATRQFVKKAPETISKVAKGEQSFTDALAGTGKDIMQKVIPMSSSVSNEELEGLGNTLTKKGGRKVLTATMEIIGNPLLVPNKIITVSGVARRHSGNWLIEKVKHEIRPNGGYTTTLEMSKNATAKNNGAGKASDKTVNKTVGAVETTNEVRIFIDNNGNDLGKKTVKVPVKK